MDKFIIFLKGKANTSAPSLRNFAGIWSIPRALMVSWLNKIFLISSSDKLENSKSLDTLQLSLGVVAFGCLSSKFVGCR